MKGSVRCQILFTTNHCYTSCISVLSLINAMINNSMQHQLPVQVWISTAMLRSSEAGKLADLGMFFQAKYPLPCIFWSPPLSLALFIFILHTSPGSSLVCNKKGFPAATAPRISGMANIHIYKCLPFQHQKNHRNRMMIDDSELQSTLLNLKIGCQQCFANLPYM